MKEVLSNIAGSIDIELYAKSIPPGICEEFGTAELYFIEQLLNDQLRPWYIAECLRNVGHNIFADKFETFDRKYNFIPNEQTQSIDILPDPKSASMDLLKMLKTGLLREELLKLRDSTSRTFEKIISDLLVSALFTKLEKVDFEDLKHKQQKINREDLATTVIYYSGIISRVHSVTFSRTVRLWLDSMDADIFSILSEKSESLLMEHSTFHTLDEQEQRSSLINDYIPLTFTSQVDTRTLPSLKAAMLSCKSMQVENTYNNIRILIIIYKCK